MAEEDSKFRDDDSSFEILEASDEDLLDYYSTNSSAWSNTLPGNLFSTMEGSFSSHPMMIEKADDHFKPGSDMAATNEGTTTICNLPLMHFQPQTEHYQMIDINNHENQDNESIFSGATISCGSKPSLENTLIPDGKPFIIALPISEMDVSTTFETTALPYQQIENADNHQLVIDQNTLAKIFPSNTENQRFHFCNSENRQETETNSNNLNLMRRGKNELVEMYPKSSKKFCPVMQSGLKIYEWISNPQSIQNLVARAQSSICSFFNMLEQGMKSVLGEDPPLTILIVADVVDSMAIAEAFKKSLGGRVVAWRCQTEEASTTPVLPVGHYEAFQLLQCKMAKARQLHDPDKNTIMVSVASFVGEVFSQRWQMGSILCLEDPHLQLNLHNFTSTVPVPNEYIHCAQGLTPEDYPLKEKGLAITLEKAIEYATKLETKDVQEFLTGVNHVTSLKSAAEILAGMYKSYTANDQK